MNISNEDIISPHATKIAKRSTIISILGLVIIISAVAYSALNLRQLEVEISDRSEELRIVEEQFNSSVRKIEDSRKELEVVNNQLVKSRESVFYVTKGINLYHQRKYTQAITAYKKALELDPKNSYIANLKGYSLFKAKRYEEAIDIMQQAVEMSPSYAWGYFDLARVLCATSRFNEAEKAAENAIKLSPGLKATMLSDGEYTRLCKSILKGS